MSFHSVPSTPSASSETVTFSVTASEFSLLASFMAPLGIDETKGESVWVTGCHNGNRQWIATSGEATAVINDAGIQINSPGSIFEWAYPVPEHILILIGKIISPTTDIVLTLGDESIRLVTADHDVFIPHISRRHVPPLLPETAAHTSVTVNGHVLWMMLTSATLWPGGGNAPDHEPIITCAFDPERQHLVLSPDWGDTTIGPASYRMTASLNTSPLGDAHFAPFNISATAILHSLRDSANALRIGDITLHQPLADKGRHSLTGEHWMLHLPTVADISPWGQDLDDLLTTTPYVWIDPQRVRLTPPDLASGHIDLIAIPARTAHAKNQYRLTYEILPMVVPTVSLYNEINEFNCSAAGCHLLIDESRLMARHEVSEREYDDLDRHLQTFITQVAGLATLYAAMAF